MKIFAFQKNYTSTIYQEDIQIYFRALFDWTVLFVLNVKNVIKNEKFYFAPNLCEMRKIC